MIPRRPDTVERRLGGGIVADRIADAAVKLFARYGYRGTTIAQIAREVGLTDAGVLYHYPTKADLFWAVVDTFEDLQRDRVLALLAPGGLTAIRNLAEWGPIIEERPDLLALQVVLGAAAVSDDSELRPYYHQRYDDLRAGIADLLAQAAGAGDVRGDVDGVFEATAFLAFLDGLRVQYFYSDGAVSLSDNLATYVDQLVSRIALDHPPR
jgi:AcrR family transcriptional regulator